MLLATAPLAQPRRAPAGAEPPGLDAYVERVREAFGVPGLAVAIVKDGQTVVARGWGTRRLGEAAPVDARTRFGIASNSKAFTATALALLVEEGRIAWDAPVTDYLPGFAMADPYVTSELTVRDLLVHRSGLSLGAGDLLWWPSNTLSRAETVARLRALPLATGFRAQYAYDNVLYMVAGQLVEAVTGQTWEAFVTQRILAPLGMADTRASIGAGMRDDSNVAATFATIDGRVQPVAAFDGENANPAAGIVSTAADLARWMTVQLDSGRVALPGVAPGRLFAPATTHELWAPVIPTPIAPQPPETAALQPQFSGYALGFNVRDYRGVKLVTHTGGLPGYVSQLTLVPSLRLGVAVLTNGESGASFQAVTQFVLDHYLAAPRTDWIAALAARTAREAADAAAAAAAVAGARTPGTTPSLPLAGYAGTYRDPWYGNVTLAVDGDRLAIRFAHTPLLAGHLEHFQHDTFVVRWTDRTLRADAYLTFALKPDGTVREARMEPVSPAVDFSFDFQDLRLEPVR